MKHKKLIMSGIAFLFATQLSINAENLVKNQESKWLEVKAVGESAERLFRAASGVAIHDVMIPVDSYKKYRVSASIQTPVGVQMFVGLIPYDSQKRQINAVNFNVVRNSETVLTGACKVGDKTIGVRDASKWPQGKTVSLAFEADDSGNYNDLPNFNIGRWVVAEKSKRDDGTWVVAFEEPVDKNYPAGTVLRRHVGGPHYIYAASKVIPKGEWQELGGRIDGMCDIKCESNKFWPVTAYVKVVILNFVKRDFMFKDVIFAEVE